MFDVAGINYLAVFIVWLIYLAIGSFWYSPSGFGKRWSKLSGVDLMKSPKEETSRAILFVAAGSLVQVVVLALVLHGLDVTSIGAGIVAALVLWLGLTALPTVGNTLYQRQSWSFWWLNASYFLVVMLIGGIILSVWR